MKKTEDRVILSFKTSWPETEKIIKKMRDGSVTSIVFDSWHYGNKDFLKGLYTWAFSNANNSKYYVDFETYANMHMWIINIHRTSTVPSWYKDTLGWQLFTKECILYCPGWNS